MNRTVLRQIDTEIFHCARKFELQEIAIEVQGIWYCK